MSLNTQKILKPKITLEVCCGSVQDCLTAEKVGADRIELNSGLELGGLTPSSALFELAKKQVKLPIMVMIRPHNGPYTYSALDFEVMLKDAQTLLLNGADGIVFGCLTSDGKIDETRVRQMAKVAKGKETVFHKAIDEVEDIEEALESLIRCGVTRVLIGGGLGKIDDHLEILGELQATYGNKIQLLPGGGVHKENCLRVLEVTKVHQLHMTGKRLEVHPKTKTTHVVVDENTLKEVLSLIR